MSSRLAWLFLRSRLAGWGGFGLVVVSVAFALWGTLQTGNEMNVNALVVAPLTMAVLIVSTTHAPFGETEWTASCPLASLRFGQLAGMLAVAAVGLLAAARLWPGDGDSLVLSRNLLGIAGIGLIAALPLGTSLAWIGPAIAAFLAVFVGAADLSQKTVTLLWTWPTRTGEDDGAIWTALLFLVAGLVAHSQRPLRNPIDEMH